MKNIFKKTAGIMIATSMLCAIMATGCTASDNGDSTATKATAEAPTVATTEPATKNTADNATEPADEQYKTDAFTIKAGQYTYLDDLGITVETTNSNHRYLDTTSAVKQGWHTQIDDERIKEVYTILMGYKVNEPDENGVFEYSETELNETVKVSIPYEEGYYLLHCQNGTAYDVATEYIDGSYVFETDKLGTFMISTVSTGKTAPTKTENVELAQQTIIDKATGLQVSGMLPVDARMDVFWCFYGDHRMHNSHSFETGAFEEDYPKADNVSKFFYSSEDERAVDSFMGRVSGSILKEDWTHYDYFDIDGKMEARIVFIKDFEILDFESDVIVTLPFDYRDGLIRAGRKAEAAALQYDYNNKSFVKLEAIPKESTETGTFQFKAKVPGQLFMGDSKSLNETVTVYTTGNKVSE